VEASDRPIDDGHWEIQGDRRSLYEITEKQTPFSNGFKSIMNQERARSHMPSIYHSWGQDRDFIDNDQICGKDVPSLTSSGPDIAMGTTRKLFANSMVER
jgi:hypothetical protein